MKRATAYRFWIRDLSSGEYVPGGTIENPTFVKIGEKKVTRVDIFGKVAGLSGNEFVLQDKTGKITVRMFGDSLQVRELAIGNLVRVIGKIRQDDRGRYVLGEIIKRIDDANYQLLREKELGAPLVEEVSF